MNHDEIAIGMRLETKVYGPGYNGRWLPCVVKRTSEQMVDGDGFIVIVEYPGGKLDERQRYPSQLRKPEAG